MSKKQNHIDQAFREKLLNREFAFDPSAWTMAEEMLDRDRGKGLWYFRRGFIAITSFVMISAALLWSINENDTYANGNNEFGQKAKVAAISSSPGVIDNQEKERISNAAEVAVPDQPNKTVSAAPEIVKTDSDPLVINSNEKKVIRPETSTEQAKPQSFAKISKEKSNAAKVVLSDKNVMNTASVTTTKQMVLEENTTKERLNPISESNVNKVASLDLKALQPFQTDLESPIEKEVIEAKTDLRKKDQGAFGLLASRLRIIGGVGTGLPTVKLENDYAYSNQAFIGLAYSQPIGKKLSVGANLIYYHTGRMNVPLEFVSNEFDFGFQNSTQKVTTKTINQLSLPLYLNYHFARRHNVYAGGEVALLMSSKTVSEGRTESDFTDGQLDVSTVQNLLTHLNTTRFGIVLGYEYLLNDRFQLGLRYRGLINSTFDKKYIKKNYTSQAVLITLGYNIKVN